MSNETDPLPNPGVPLTRWVIGHCGSGDIVRLPDRRVVTLTSPPEDEYRGSIGGGNTYGYRIVGLDQRGANVDYHLPSWAFGAFEVLS